MRKYRKKRHIIAGEQVIDQITDLSDQYAAEKIYIVFKLSHCALYGRGKAVIDQNA